MKRLFNLVRSPLALIYFGEEQGRREGGTPSLLCNFTTDSSRPRAATARSPHLRSRRTHRAPLQEAFDLFTLRRATRLIAGRYRLHVGGPPGHGWDAAGGRTVALDGGGDSSAGRGPSPGWRGGDAGVVASRRGSVEARRGEAAAQRCPRSRLAAVTRTVESPRAQCALVSGSPAPGG